MESRRLCGSTSPLREHGGLPHPMCTGFFLWLSGCCRCREVCDSYAKTLLPVQERNSRVFFFVILFFLFGDFLKKGIKLFSLLKKIHKDFNV